MQLRIALDPDRVVPTLVFKQLEERGNGEGRVGAEPAPLEGWAHRSGVSRQHRLQDTFPAIGAVSVAGPKRAAL